MDRMSKEFKNEIDGADEWGKKAQAAGCKELDDVLVKVHPAEKWTEKDL